MDAPSDPNLDTASLGEVAWVDPSGAPRAAGVLPLVRGGRPVLALTLDRADLASDLAAAEVVDLVVREPRNSGPLWRPSGWRCGSRLVEDLTGERFTDELLLQELRRYPPARRYADSPMLMREHWWYLPRLLVQLDPVEALPAPEARRSPDDLLLVTARDGAPVTSGATASRGAVRAAWGPVPAPGPGALFGQDATYPDLERWDTWCRPVAVGPDGITPSAPLPDLTPPRMPGLLARWRAERRFADRCRGGLAAWGG